MSLCNACLYGTVVSLLPSSQRIDGSLAIEDFWIDRH